MVKLGGRTIGIAPGNFATLTRKKNAAFDAVNPVNEVAYRGIQKIDADNGVQAFTGNFSIITALSNVTGLNTWLGSKDPELRKMASAIFKNAAVLYTMQRRTKGPIA